MRERSKTAAILPETRRDSRISPKSATASSRSIYSPADHVLLLQGTIGNQAVGRLFKSGFTRQEWHKREAKVMGTADAGIVRRLPSPSEIMKQAASMVACRPNGSLSITRTERVGLAGPGFYGADFNHVFRGVPAGCSLYGFQVSEAVTTRRDDFQTGFTNVAVGVNIWNITSQNKLHRPDSIWSAAGRNGLGINPVRRWPAVMENRQTWHFRAAANQSWQRGPAVTITVTASGNRQNPRAIIITTRDNGASRSEPYTGPAIRIQP